MQQSTNDSNFPTNADQRTTVHAGSLRVERSVHRHHPLGGLGRRDRRARNRRLLALLNVEMRVRPRRSRSHARAAATGSGVPIRSGCRGRFADAGRLSILTTDERGRRRSAGFTGRQQHSTGTGVILTSEDDGSDI